MDWGDVDFEVRWKSKHLVFFPNIKKDIDVGLENMAFTCM